MCALALTAALAGPALLHMEPACAAKDTVASTARTRYAVQQATVPCLIAWLTLAVPATTAAAFLQLILVGQTVLHLGTWVCVMGSHGMYRAGMSIVTLMVLRLMAGLLGTLVATALVDTHVL